MCQNFLDVTYYVKETDAWDIDVHDENKYLPTNQIYLGVSASDSISELPEAEKQVVYERCRNFYIELIFQHRKRFQFDDKVYYLLTVLDPQNALHLKTPSLRQVYQRFSQYLSDVSMADVAKEWRGLSLLPLETLGFTSSDDTPNTSDFWNKVFALENAAGIKMFGNVEKVSILLCLPSSNASVERVFSQLKLIKTSHRNKLSTDTIAALI